MLPLKPAARHIARPSPRLLPALRALPPSIPKVSETGSRERSRLEEIYEPGNAARCLDVLRRDLRARSFVSGLSSLRDLSHDQGDSDRGALDTASGEIH